jgi:hypothetical protein
VTIVIGQNPSGGHLTGLAKVNAANGVATFSGLMIDSAGTGYTLQATATGVAAVTSDSFNVTAGAVSADLSSVTVAPTTIAASAPGAGSTTATITVTARDQSGNVVSGAAVTVSATGTGNTLTPASGSGNTNAQGVFTVKMSSTKAGTKTISATINAVAVTQTATDTVTPGAPTVLVFTQQPTATTATATMTPPVTVTVRDSFGNTVTGFATAITVAIGANPSAGTLSGTTSHVPTNGVATFNNLSIDKAGAGYTLTATTTGLTATSAAFDIR